MMYDPIFAKSFSRHHRKRFGCLALLFSFIFALTISSSSKPSFHPFTFISDAVTLQLSINSIQDLLIDADITYNSHQPEESSRENVESKLPQKQNADTQVDGDEEMLVTNKTELPRLEHQNRAEAPLPLKDEINKVVVVEEPVCRVLKSKADYCDIHGDVRVDSNSSTIYLITPSSSTTTSSWTIQPYPRKGIAFVKQWTVKASNIAPKCTHTHSQPAILFSTGGFAGNHFHDFADLLFPLFTTSFPHNTDVHFLTSDTKPWWLSKYRPLLHHLTKHPIIDTDHQKNEIHCYNRLTAGLKFHRELVVDPTSGVTMSAFRHLLRRTYSLGRKRAVVRRRGGGGAKPRLMIVSRKRTRILMNEGEISRVAGKLGFEVVSAESDVSTNLTRFAEVVNSCDVMMGVHGAGLTNMVFLPEKAVVIQVVPWGGIDGFAKLDFGDPTAGMNLRYVEYKIGVKESSLSQGYAVDDPVLTDPVSIHRQGWDRIRDVYLHNQNVTLNVPRFRHTLAKALRLLRS